MTSMQAQGRDLRGRDLYDHKLHGSGRADSEGDINLGEGGRVGGRARATMYRPDWRRIAATFSIRPSPPPVWI